MRAQDWQDSDSARSLAISELAEVCAAMGLSWSATEKEFVIALPDVILTQVKPIVKTKKRFDISNWGPVGVDETIYLPPSSQLKRPIDPELPRLSDEIMPDDFQLPDTGEILEEGEPPKGDTEAEQ